MHNKPTPKTASDTRMPGLHQFKEVCRLAESGDADARSQLDGWISYAPELLSEATDMIAVAREYLIDFVASASPESSALWRRRIDTDINEILGATSNDRLSQMCAEVVVLAWLNVMRCSIMPNVAGQDVKRSTYWGSSVDVAQRRWAKVNRSFQQHLKHAQKKR